MTAVGATTPAPVFVRYLAAVASAVASGSALMAATTCAAVLVTAPVSLVARLTVIALPETVTPSGRLLAPGLRSSTVTSLPPSWPHAPEVSTTAWLAAAVASAEVPPAYGVVVPTIACALRW